MKILITGGLGYLGSATATMFVDYGQEVAVVDNHLTGIQIPSCKMFDCDIRETRLADIMLEFSPDIVYHFADVNDREESISHPEKYYDINLGGTMNVIESCIKAGVDKLVFGSSFAVYGKTDDAEIPENHPMRPKCIYGRTKHICEQYLFDVARKHNIKFASLRYTNVAGATYRGGKWFGDVKENCGVISQYAKDLSNGDPLVLYGNTFETYNGSSIRDYVHIDDVLKLHFIIAKRLSEEGYKSTYFNIGSGAGVSTSALLDNMIDGNGGSVGLIQMGPRVYDSPVAVADITKANFELGWEPEEYIVAIVDSVVRYQKLLTKIKEDVK